MNSQLLLIFLGVSLLGLFAVSNYQSDLSADYYGYINSGGNNYYCTRSLSTNFGGRKVLSNVTYEEIMKYLN